MLVNQPAILSGAFAAEGDKNTIPANNDGLSGLASIAKGFPPITQQPLAQGGLPPQRQDFNGIFNLFSQFLLYAQNGGVYAYNNTLDYQPPCIISHEGVFYSCIAENGPSTSAGVQPVTNTDYWQKLVPDIAVMTGASASNAGKSGMVPAPAAGSQNKALFGDATYKQVAQSVNNVAADEEGNIEITLSDFGIEATADELNETIGAKDNLQNQIDRLEFLIKNFPAWWLNRGNGSDGAFNPSNNTTISSTKNFTSVNIPSGVTVTVAHGARLLCTGAFTNAGTIQVQTVNMAGVGGAGAPDPGNGSPGKSNTNTEVVGMGGNGGKGGNGFYGPTGGWGGAAIGTVKRVVTEESIITTPGGSGAGGGGGGSHGGSQYVPGPAGASGGGGGGSTLITCTTFNNTGTITANGARGNNGGGGGGGCGGGGGGGGGAGGAILVIADTVTSQGTITATGGAGGSGGGGDTGAGAQNGATGGKGADGVVHVVAINQS